LKVNYQKSNIYPINVANGKMEILAKIFIAKLEPILSPTLASLAKPKVENFLPLVQRIERRVSSTSNFLTQVGRLEMVNSMLSSLPTYFMSIMEMPPTIRQQIDKYRKHCMWRGSNLNTRKPPLAAWKLATKPKREGGLGIINLKTQNDALLLKILHKFFNKVDCL
jgi:hypothetical protein